MSRPCFLVVDQEHASSLSTRKLVLETAKYNVITAYSAKESVELLRRFPAVDGAIVDSTVDDIPCDELAKVLKTVQPNLRVIAICPPGRGYCESADYMVPSFQPASLLEMMKKIYPEQTTEINEREKDLHDKL
jgi:response regulator RpfG family c-di-GMP phosphodiesterase